MNESLWLDEATTAMVSKMSLFDIFTKFLPNDFHPPLYYIVMKFWVSIFGSSEIALRAPSLIFAFLTIFIVYKLAGKYSAIILATNPLFIYYAQEARSYMMSTFLVSALVYSYVKKRWILFSILLAGVGMTDYIGLFILPVFWILEYKNWKKFSIYNLPLVASFLIWLPVFIKQITAGFSVSDSWASILGQPTVKNILLIPAKFIIGRVSFESQWLYGLIIIVMFGVYGYLLFRVIRLIRAIRNYKVYCLWLFMTIIFGIIISFWIPTLTYFRYLFALPAFCILVAKGIGKSKLLFTFVLCLNLLFTIYYLLTPNFHREDWRSASFEIGTDQIVTPLGLQTEALKYYGKSDQIVSKPSADVVWLSRYVWQIFDPSDSTRIKIEDLGYTKSGVYNFNKLELFKYKKI